MPGLELEWLEEAPLRFHCTCNPERVQAGVRLLGAAELQEMIDEGEEPEVHCDWCSVTYRVDGDALARGAEESTAALGEDPASIRAAPRPLPIREPSGSVARW